jgi:hypothetical protein
LYLLLFLTLFFVRACAAGDTLVTDRESSKEETKTADNRMQDEGGVCCVWRGYPQRHPSLPRIKTADNPPPKKKCDINQEEENQNTEETTTTTKTKERSGEGA